MDWTWMNWKRRFKMREPEIPSDPDLVPCWVCLKEIPVSEATSEEAVDYVLHFCGLKCYAKWEKRETMPEHEAYTRFKNRPPS
jgi:hypothetical protein